MVDPHFVSSGNISQKGVIFVRVAVHITLADCQTVTLVLSCEVFRVQLAPTVWNLIGLGWFNEQNLAWCQRTRHFNYSYPSITPDLGKCLFCSPELPSSVILVLMFLNIFIRSYKLRCCKELFPYYAEILRRIFALSRNSAHKSRISAHSSSLVHMKSEAAMSTHLRRHYNWPVKVESSSRSRNEFLPLTCAQNTRCSQQNKR
jgi:hypothetical protein